MVRKFQAVYEGGVLRPVEPLRLDEHQLVSVVILDDTAADEVAKGRFAVATLKRRHFQAAEGLLRLHAVERGLRTLDALQLSVALDMKGRGAASELVTSDKKLGAAAAFEGLSLVDPTQT
jgi:predicted DNA-binding antitoxin AbrB/MazE fold protein